MTPTTPHPVVWHPPELNPDFPEGAWREAIPGRYELPREVPTGLDSDGELVTETRTETVEADLPGRLMVFVNASPDHRRHGGGWFEPFDGDPADYHPMRDAEPDEPGYLTRDEAADEARAQAEADRANRQRVRTELEELIADTDDPDRRAELTDLMEDFA